MSNTSAFFMISTSVVWTNRHVAATSSRYGAYYKILYIHFIVHDMTLHYITCHDITLHNVMILNIIMYFSSGIVSSSRSEDGGCALVCVEDGSLCIHDWANLFCCGNGQGQGLLNDAVALPRQTTKCFAGFRPCSSLLVEKHVFNVTFSFGDLSSSSHRCFHCLLHNPAMVRCFQ